MQPKFIYLDNHATTQVDSRVLETMLPFFSVEFGNAGSKHAIGERAKEVVEQAREEIASCIGAKAKEIVFTSGATESNNLALRGVFGRTKVATPHLISIETEHKAVLDPLTQLAKRGAEVTLLSVQANGHIGSGRIDPQQVADAITEQTILVSVMFANNEIGVLQPIQEIGSICRERGVLFHCDATQAVGKLPVDIEALNVDLMSFSAHKFYGPKGIGALYVRSRNPLVRLQPQLTGGGQQEGRRSGTLNVPGIVGMANALAICISELEVDRNRIRTLRDRMWNELKSRIDGLTLNGPALDAVDFQGECFRLDANLNFSVSGVEGETLMLQVPQIAISSGATCAADSPEPSHVLRALSLDEDTIRSSLRIGLGRFTTEEEVTTAVDWIASGIEQIREFSR